MFSAPQEEKEEDLQDVTVVPSQDTVPPEGHSGDVSQDNGGLTVMQEEETEEAAATDGSDIAQPTDPTTDPVETQQEQKPNEEQSPEELEGVEESGEVLPTEKVTGYFSGKIHTYLSCQLCTLLLLLHC